MSSSPIKNIAIIGGSGNLGAPTIAALVKSNIHHITVITRAESSATFPSSVTVKRGDYSDPGFLHSALSGQDALILMLSIPTLDQQGVLIEAAAKAGVKYVLPTEYGSDTGNQRLVDAVPMLAMKKSILSKIQELGMKSIGVITNPWLDYCIRHGVFGFNVAERKATLYTDGMPFNTTTIAQAAAGIAAMLALPESELQQRFANDFLRLSSFQLTQPEIFAAIKRATKTSDADWAVERKVAQMQVDEGNAKLAQGNMEGMVDLLFGYVYMAGMGGDYSGRLHNGVLGLKEENLDEAVRAAVGA